MLVDGHAAATGRVEHSSGMKHPPRQLQRLGGRHSAHINRHQQRGHLVVGDPALHEPVDDMGDLVAGQLSAVSFLGNDVGCVHRLYRRVISHVRTESSDVAARASPLTSLSLTWSDSKSGGESPLSKKQARYRLYN